MGLPPDRWSSLDLSDDDEDDAGAKVGSAQESPLLHVGCANLGPAAMMDAFVGLREAAASRQ